MRIEFKLCRDDGTPIQIGDPVQDRTKGYLGTFAGLGWEGDRATVLVNRPDGETEPFWPFELTDKVEQVAAAERADTFLDDFLP